MLLDSLLSSPFCSSHVSFSFLLQLSVSRSGSVREARWHQAHGSPFLSLSPSLSLCLLSFSVPLCPELNCDGVSVQLSVQASWVPSWSPLAMWSPLPSYYSASSSHQFIFNAPSLLSLTVSPHNSHSVSASYREIHWLGPVRTVVLQAARSICTCWLMSCPAWRR